MQRDVSPSMLKTTVKKTNNTSRITKREQNIQIPSYIAPTKQSNPKYPSCKIRAQNNPTAQLNKPHLHKTKHPIPHLKHVLLQNLKNPPSRPRLQRARPARQLLQRAAGRIQHAGRAAAGVELPRVQVVERLDFE